MTDKPEEAEPMVTMTAVDTLHVSSVGSENIAPGSTFDVSDAVAKQLEDRGLATRGGKAEKPLANKMEKAPISNKKAKG